MDKAAHVMLREGSQTQKRTQRLRHEMVPREPIQADLGRQPQVGTSYRKQERSCGKGRGGKRQDKRAGCVGPPRGCQGVFSDLGGWSVGADVYSGSLLKVIRPQGHWAMSGDIGGWPWRGSWHPVGGVRDAAQFSTVSRPAPQGMAQPPRQQCRGETPTL